MSTYAIISLGGKQYRVTQGQRLLVDRLPHDAQATFSPAVLLIGGDGGADLAPKAEVTAQVVDHVLGKKIRIGKYKKRTGYKRHTGHRSKLTQIEIVSIGGAKPAARKASAKKEAPAEEAAAEAPATDAPATEEAE